MSISQKLGRFAVRRTDIERALSGDSDAQAELSALFSRCIVIEATHRWDMRQIDYLAASPDFDEVPECIEAPIYECEFERIEDWVAGQRVVTVNPKFKRRAQS